MILFNILFQFDNSTHIANVSYSAKTERYTIYFTDVDLILAFGSKAEYSRLKGMKLLKQDSRSNDLVEAVTKELQLHKAA